jgi:alpha-beta hydrolase superfamily lysophospholipase
MKSFFLTEIITRDNLIHQGIYFEPKKKSKSAILYVHGLGSTFYSNNSLIFDIVSKCEDCGFGFASYNNRGHDTVSGIKKLDPYHEKGYTRVAGGASQEIFADSIYDIDAGISFLIQQGYSEIYLCGHSSGANKVCLYAGTQCDVRVKGVILSSPVSDRLAPEEKRSWILDIGMKFLYYFGFGDLLIFNSRMTLTPKRYLSLFKPHSLEDVFAYGDSPAQMNIYSKISKPLLILLGNNDEYLDRKATQVMNVFHAKQHSQMFEGYIIPDGLHSFQGKEKMVAEIIGKWINKIKVT